MHRTPTPKPIIHLGQLRHVASAYLTYRELGFSRPAIESHLHGLKLADKELCEEVDAVLAQTAENPALPVVLTASR
jgi:hypothetical protein